MIDKNGKLFGIINIVDLFIVLVVIVAAVFIGKKLTTMNIGSSGNQEVTLKFFAEEVPSFVAEQVKVDDPVVDEGKSIPLGNVISFTAGPGYMYVPDAEGELKKADKELYNSLEIVSKLNTKVVANGIEINGNIYSVGHSLTIRAGKAKVYLKISDIISN